ncbi:HlyC/CorC family transporter [Weissella minor]|uniref:hemolysin family protein n=1 Tax=Weissella minor TaxID=1620 RepID=UPI001BB0B9E9|nr:hemolysin family protein [Weissella minor]MBS0950357.1 HlyC/CorC family transporter [Weissella minor]
MSNAQLWMSLLIIILVLVFAAIFVAAEFALVKVRKSTLREMQEDRDKPSRKIDRTIYMVEHLNEYLSTTQVGITLSGLLLGFMGESTVAHLLLNMGIIQKMTGPSSGVIASVIALILLTYVEVVFTELVPKNVSIEFPVKMALAVSGPLHFFHLLFYPFVWLLNISANGVTHMMGLKTASEDDDVYSEAEILSLSRNAARQGQLQDEDYLLMQRAFEMNDKDVEDIMIDRTQMVVIDINTSIKDAVKVYFTSKFSRLPVVADNDKDKVLGYIFNYDLMRQAAVNDSVSVRKILRQMPTVPEKMPIQDALQEMIKKRTPMVVIKDEFGGTSGIVTDKDVYEELFGTVRDEVDDVADDLVEKLGSDDAGVMHYRVSGKMTLYDFERYFKTEIREFDRSDMVTLTGYMLDDNPNARAGSEMQVGPFKLTALHYKDAYISDFEVIRVPESKIEPTT